MFKDLLRALVVVDQGILGEKVKANLSCILQHAEATAGICVYRIHAEERTTVSATALQNKLRKVN